MYIFIYRKCSISIFCDLKCGSHLSVTSFIWPCHCPYTGWPQLYDYKRGKKCLLLFFFKYNKKRISPCIINYWSFIFEARCVPGHPVSLGILRFPPLPFTDIHDTTFIFHSEVLVTFFNKLRLFKSISVIMFGFIFNLSELE